MKRDSTRYGRVCRGYKPYRAPDLRKTGVNVLWSDDFSCRIPDETYAYYQPLRLDYAEQAKKSILDTLLPGQADDIKKSKTMDELIRGLGEHVDDVK